MALAASVLIVDDNARIVAMLARILESLGVDYEIARNGREGVEKLSANLYKVVLLDFEMPELDGVGVFSWIKRELAQQPYVVVLTSDTRPETRARFHDLGCNAFVQKPFTVADIVEVLKPAALTDPADAPRKACGGGNKC